jgi:hypothetical protein
MLLCSTLPSLTPFTTSPSPPYLHYLTSLPRLLHHTFTTSLHYLAFSTLPSLPPFTTSLHYLAFSTLPNLLYHTHPYLPYLSCPTLYYIALPYSALIVVIVILLKHLSRPCANVISYFFSFYFECSGPITKFCGWMWVTPYKTT